MGEPMKEILGKTSRHFLLSAVKRGQTVKLNYMKSSMVIF